MSLQLAEQHKIIVERCKGLLQVVLNEDKYIVNEIMNKSQSKVEDFNKENLTIIDATRTEIGLFNGMVKRIIEGKYINKLIKQIIEPEHAYDFDYLCDKEERQLTQYEDFEDEYFYEPDLFCDTCKKEFNERLNLLDEYRLKVKNIQEEFKNACNNTTFTDDLMLRKISLTRSIVVKHDPTEVQKILAKKIHNEVFLVFQEQNKELLTKYNF
jgi:hypothetical protein